MGAEARIRVRRVVIGIPRATQDRGDLDAALQTLLPESKAFEFLKPVLLCRAIYDRIFEQLLAHARYVGCGFDAAAATRVFWVWRLGCIFEFPGIAALVMDQTRVVVAFLREGVDVSISVRV